MKQYAYLQGVAGTGKSYKLQELHDTNPVDTILTATTGIAAVNMGTGVTINSLLWYYNSKSLLDSWTSGKLDFRLGKVYADLGIRQILLDEVSMLPASDLTVLCLALDRLNRQLYLNGKEPMGLTLAGDFAQLPPIDGGYAFESEHWQEKFEDNTTILRHVYRQEDKDFIQALEWVRSGEGKKAAEFFEPLMNKLINPEFEGTTLYPYNAAVDRHNAYRLERVKGDKVTFEASRVGKQRPEWTKGIPDILQLKEGSLVMVLANKRGLEYCNGDLGTLITKKDDHAEVELQRGGVVDVEYIKRDNEDNVKGKKQVVGSITYMPLRLAYGSTVHKCLNPDTLIQTLSGMKKLSQIQPGDYISNEEKFVKVATVAPSDQRAYRLTTYNGYSIICSPDHNVMTEHGLVRTDQLVEGTDRLSLGCVLPADGTSDTNVAYLLGILVGDGSYNDPNEGNIHFTSNVPELQKEFVVNFEALGIHPGYRKDNRGCYVTSKPVRYELLNKGLNFATAQKKVVPHWITTSYSRACAFLAGLFDTDGHIGKSGIVLTTVSADIAEQVQVLLLAVGIPSRRKYYKSEYGCGFYWQVRVNANGVEKFKSAIKLKHKKKAAKLLKLKPNRIINQWDGYDVVEKVEDLGLVIPMLDIEVVSQDHLFSGNGVVTHNSQGLTLDNVQVDFRADFYTKTPGMLYVALSRARSKEGLRLCGGPKTFVKHCRRNTKIERFL